MPGLIEFSMGNAQLLGIAFLGLKLLFYVARCCKSVDTDPDAAAEAMPTMETWPANIGKPAIEVPAVSGGNSPQERLYKVSLQKSGPQKGLGYLRMFHDVSVGSKEGWDEVGLGCGLHG